MVTGLLPIISYVFISTFTPGPSNISSASMAVIHGYKNTLKYQFGLAIGVFLLMLLSGWFSSTLLNLFPALEPILRYVGAAYILYLAFIILKASYTFTEKEEQSLGLVQGMMLNILNPKLVVYAFTLFTGFLASMTINFAALIIVCSLLAAVSFCATSLWALFGSAIKRYLHNPHLKTVVNIILSLTLVYTAATLIGLV
jgi:cysteine/O-acetylserine efflux protein